MFNDKDLGEEVKSLRGKVERLERQEYGRRIEQLQGRGPANRGEIRPGEFGLGRFRVGTPREQDVGPRVGAQL